MLLNSLCPWKTSTQLSIQIDNKLKNLTCSVRVMVLAESYNLVCILLIIFNIFRLCQLHENEYDELSSITCLMILTSIF